MGLMIKKNETIEQRCERLENELGVAREVERILYAELKQIKLKQNAAEEAGRNCFDCEHHTARVTEDDRIVDVCKIGCHELDRRGAAREVASECNGYEKRKRVSRDSCDGCYYIGYTSCSRPDDVIRDCMANGFSKWRADERI